jgi:hypothetical protein
MYHGEGGGVKGGDPSWPPEWEKEVARDRRGGFWGLWWGFMVGGTNVGHHNTAPPHGDRCWEGNGKEGERNLHLGNGRLYRC